MKAVRPNHWIRWSFTDLNCLAQDNVLMSDEGQPLICDFGLARIVPESASLSNTTTAGGSVRWMAPEFFRRDNPVTKHCKETDVWGFGATIYVSFIFNVS